MISAYAKYTVVLKSLMDNPQTKTKLDEALSKYPIYVGKKEYDLIPTREALNAKILNHYKYREIGFETVGRFLDELEIAMSELMPYYNELFKSVEIMADLENPFDNVDVTETFEQEREETTSNEQSATGERTTTGTSESEHSTNSGVTSSSEENTNGTKTANNEKRVSDTPQNSINTVDNYLTEHVKDIATDNTNNQLKTTAETETNEGGFTESSSRETDKTESTAEGSATTNATVKHTMTKKGNQGVNTYAHDMNEFRTSIIDVVDRIIHDKRIAELFMLVW